MDGNRPVQSRIDLDEDGRIDRWEYYGPDGSLLRVGFSRKNDGKPDAWAYSSPDGRVERIEVSSTGDERKIDRWEYYDPSRPGTGPAGAGTLVRVEEDTNGDGRPDKWEVYRDGVLVTTAFDENADGRPDRRMTYQDGTLVLIESDPDAAGRFRRRVEVK